MEYSDLATKDLLFEKDQLIRERDKLVSKIYEIDTELIGIKEECLKRQEKSKYLKELQKK